MRDVIVAIILHLMHFMCVWASVLCLRLLRYDNLLDLKTSMVLIEHLKHIRGEKKYFEFFEQKKRSELEMHNCMECVCVL